MTMLSNTGARLKKAFSYKESAYFNGIYSLKEFPGIFLKRKNLVFFYNSWKYLFFVLD